MRRDDWETPEGFFQELNREFHFDLDVCASQGNAKCEKFFSEADDGLAQSWGGYRVWCNPPYKQIGKWVRKAYYEGHKPNTTVVLLLPSRTDTRYFHNYIQHRAEVRFIRGRLRFDNSKQNAPFASMLVIYRGPEEDKQITMSEAIDGIRI